MILYALDTETHLIQAGLAAPPMVCASFCSDDTGARVVSKAEGLALFHRLLDDPGVLLGGKSLFYDFGVACVEDPKLVPKVFAAIDAGRVVSAEILEALHDNARGLFGKDPATGAPIASEEGAGALAYSLALLESRYLGIDRSAEKENGWRLKYALLDGVPVEQWPQEAIDYPRADARGTFEVLKRQLDTTVERPHAWEDAPEQPDPGAFMYVQRCKLCGALWNSNKTTEPLDCPKAEPKPLRFNLQCALRETRAAWALHLIRLWGIRTDPEMVPEVVAEILKEHEDSRRKFWEHGIVRVRTCNKKEGVYERADEITDAQLLAWESTLAQSAEEWCVRRVADVRACLRARKKNPERPLRFAEDKTRLRDLVVAAYKNDPPMTAGGESGDNPQISTSRDTLVESGDELLEAYGEAGPNEKLLSTYVDVLRQGTTVPINPTINSMVATQRISMLRPNLTQLPRGKEMGKGPARIRECFVPRGARFDLDDWVFFSCDYASIELVTLGQCCLDLFGESSIAQAINAGQDLHVRMAARMLGISYEAALAGRKTDPVIKNARQSAKPVNYGLPGLMGPPKLVATARKDGIVFCELAGVSENCFNNPRVLEFKGYKIGPTCCECLALAVRYKALWYEEWQEMREYHKVTVAVAEECGEGVPLESFGDGMLRLESNPNACSNHFFQNRAAQGAKAGLWLVQKEAYNDRSSVLYNNVRTDVFVHDEIFGEAREAVAHEGAYRVAELMKQGMREFVPDVRIDVEPALCRRWFKGAETVKDKAGRLKPWWPEKWTWGPDQEQMAKDKAA